MSQYRLSRAINGSERNLRGKLVALQIPADQADHASSAHAEGSGNGQRALNAGEAGLTVADRRLLDAAVRDGSLELTSDAGAAAAADAVIICVPTPADAGHRPDLSALRGACGTVVGHAREGQTIILTSASYVGTTRDLLIRPLEQRGLRVGEDVYVAFSAGRIDPGNDDHLRRETPRVVGGATQACAARAAEVIRRLTDVVYVLSSAEAAEATKLHESVFCAVTLALANGFCADGGWSRGGPRCAFRMKATGLMVVPVRSGSGMVCLQCGRLPTGERVGIAFTTEARLAGVMGADQPWIHLNDRAMKAMLAPLGVTRIQVDPGLVSAGLPNLGAGEIAEPPAARDSGLGLLEHAAR